MEGQYSNEEMLQMSNIISSVSQLLDGLIIRKVGKTINYYCQHSDKSWTNFKCITVD
jgi:hypothetical protein